MDTKARKFIAANISKLRKTRNIEAAKVCWFTVVIIANNKKKYSIFSHERRAFHLQE